MSEERQEHHPILLDTIVAKVQRQDQRIQLQDEKLTQLGNDVKIIPEQAKDIAQIKKDTQEVKSIGEGQKTLMDQMHGFFNTLDIAIHVLRNPVPTKVEHHHHVPKVTWIAAGLFLSLCLICSGWYMTAQTSEQYQANDIKYRRLKLTADSASRHYLYRLDSLYLVDPAKMEKYVKEQELLRQERLELQDQLQAVNKKIGQDTKTGQGSRGRSRAAAE